ncbi:DnaD domain-containing protein [Ruminiclostridium josui]|uniref:DnaD domain-containing protein n=1 Tax=Ruminiclostridium josui TaxID=1499 RepID=UPI0006CF4FDD|nr:DnaD domain protein [Ruminiclostridium josui]
MARRRYISTEISIDKAVNKLAIEYGDFAALLYTWMIPHAEDTCFITADPYEIFNKVIPARRDKTEEDIQHAVDGMIKLGLVQLSDNGKMLSFPPESFYKYQTYIPEKKRRTSAKNTDHHRQSQKSTEEHRNPSPSPIPTYTPNPIEEEEEGRSKVGEVFKFFNQNINPITPFQVEILSQAIDIDGLEPELILEVLKDSMGKREKWSWINRVLGNCSRDGVKTLTQYNYQKTIKDEAKKSRDAPKQTKTVSFCRFSKGDARE